MNLRYLACSVHLGLTGTWRARVWYSYLPAEPGKDLVAEGVLRDEVGVVLQHRGHDVVAVAELGQQ
jgi:hypothetical protein